jgi:3-mercaptopyruvate sulfurtransferase SseA
MRRLISLSAAFVLAVALLAACNSTEKNQGVSGNGSSNASPAAATPSTQPTPNDGVRRITLAELRDALDKGTAIVVDTRSADNYKQSHIKGSINIPADQIANRINELPRDKLIVAYCS